MVGNPDFVVDNAANQPRVHPKFASYLVYRLITVRIYAANLFGISHVESIGAASPAMFFRCDWTKVLWIYTRGYLAKMMQLVVSWYQPLIALVYQAVGFYRASIYLLLAVSLSVWRTLPYPAGRCVAPIFRYPCHLHLSMVVAKIGIRFSPYLWAYVLSCASSGNGGFQATSAPAKPVGNIRALFVPPSAIISRTLRYILQVLHLPVRCRAAGDSRLAGGVPTCIIPQAHTMPLPKGAW